jgi:hypothetical protein
VQLLVAEGGHQHDGGRGRITAEAGEDVEPRPPGHPDVGDDQVQRRPRRVGAVTGQQLQDLRTVARLDDLVAVAGQRGGHERPQRTVILRNQDPPPSPRGAARRCWVGAIRAGFQYRASLIFTLELTGDVHVLLPVLIATSCAHLFTVLTMRRSILTEKVARRGFHVTREYGVDPLEVLFVRDVVQPGEPPAGEEPAGAEPAEPEDPAVFLDETLRVTVYRMAEARATRLPVHDRAAPGRPVGRVTLDDLLKARLRHLEEEQRREGALPLWPQR